jgi:hypothetical protein
MTLFDNAPWLKDGGVWLPRRKLLRPERYFINPGVIAGGAIVTRPTTFARNSGCSLATNLQLALLGNNAGSGTSYDTSVNGYNGTLTGFTGGGNTPAVQWQRANNRPYLGFNGTSDYVSTPYVFSGTGAFTISALVYITALSANQTIIGNRTPAGSNGFEILTTATPQWIFQLPGGSGVVIAGTPVANTWTSVIATFDGSVNMTLYINNVSIGTSSSAGMTASATGVVVGNRPDLTRYFLGYMSDLIIPSRVVTAGERTALANLSNYMLQDASGVQLII